MFRSAILLSVLVLGPGMAWGQECDGGCGDGCCGPRIQFLDDVLLLGHVPSRRDPFEERIETERHDFTQSTKTVGRGVIQLEMGYTYFYLDKDEEIENAHTTPEMAVRLGLTDDVEFRIRWTYGWKDLSEGHDRDSAEDLHLSFKLGVTEPDVWIPESALEVRFTAPTGGEEFTTDWMEFGLDYIYDWEVAEGWIVYGSTGFGTNGLGDFGLIPEEPADDRFITWTQSVAIGIDLTERTTMYNEFFGLFSYGLHDEYANVYYNMGIDYYITDDLVLDVRVGVGLTPDSDDMFGGVGGGYRF